MRIGVDIMGSESSPETLFQAVVEIVKNKVCNADFVVFATREAAGNLLDTYSDLFLEESTGSQVDFCFVNEFISMNDDPLHAVRQKKGSSLAVGIKQLSEGKIEALVTSGNTGALIVLSSIHLEPIKDVERPALLATLPCKNRSLALVDVGGNVSCKSHHLVQFAHFGAAYQRCRLGIETPKIGLLNIGVESKKGTQEVREAYRILDQQANESDSKIAFLGNLEGREVFEGKVDVLVTDGFTGNVLLKTAEGLSSFIFNELKEKIEEHHLLDSLQQHFSYDEYPGALVCGVDKIVIKCHGAASPKAMKNSILGAVNLVENKLIDNIKRELQNSSSIDF